MNKPERPTPNSQLTKKLAEPNPRPAAKRDHQFEPAVGDLGELSERRQAARRVAEQRARTRTLARSQSISEKLAIAAEEVSSAITEAGSAVHEIHKAIQSIASAAEESSSAAEESRSAISQIEKTADSSHANARSLMTR
jgi:methyl-accepting chemotaxis protein